MWTILFDEAEAKGVAKGEVRGENKLASLLRRIEPGSEDYYMALDENPAQREKLYLKYGVTEKDWANEVATFSPDSNTTLA